MSEVGLNGLSLRTTLRRDTTRRDEDPPLVADDEAAFDVPGAAKRRPLRVLVAHNVPRATNGGMSRIMTFIHDRLARGAGHEVDYFCAEDAHAALSGRAARFAFPLLVLRRATRAARAGRPYHIVNVHEPSSAAVTAFKRLAGSPVVVVTSHGVERRAWELALEELRLGRRGPSTKTRVVYPLTGLRQSDAGLRRADHVFCLSFEDRDYLRARMGVRAESITRIYPAADSVFGDAALGRDYARGARLLFAATWRKNKGVEDLVPAFASLAERRADVTLTVLGGGVDERVAREAFPARVRERVNVVRAGDDAEAARVFAASDIFVLPSLFEGTPLTLMEAMASGLPVVTTATCGMRDVIRDGENGLLVPVRSPEKIADAVERLCCDAELRARLGRAARIEAAEKYNWETVAAPVAEAYERLCARRR